MSIDVTKKTFNFMLSNFEMANKEMPPNFKSLNWDAFPNGYSDLIKNGRDLASYAKKCLNNWFQQFSLYF